MSIVDTDRTALLQRHGHAYGALHLAVTFTDGIEGEDAKRVTRKGWNQTPRLADGPFGAALLAGRGLERNPVVVLGASGLIGIDVDGPEGARLLRRITSERLPLGPEGLEVAKDGYLVCPPSSHASGHIYAFAAGREPWSIPLAELDIEPFLVHAKRGRTEAIGCGSERRTCLSKRRTSS